MLHHTRARLRDHLPLQADGSVCTTDDLLPVLLGVAVKRQTIEAICADLFGTPIRKPSAAISMRNCGWTTSRNAAYRFVLMALRFILLNEWLLLRWCYTQVPRRGGRWLATQHFALSRFVTFLRRALEHQDGVVHAIVAAAEPRL